MGALVARAEQDVRTVFGIFADERANGIGTHPRRHRHGIGLVHIVSGSRIGGARLTDVTALCIQNNGDACAAIISNQLLQHEHRLHAHAFVVSAVRLHHGGRHVTLETAFQNFGIETLDLVFGTTFGAARVDQLHDRIHAEANRVTALGDTFF